MKTDTGSLLAGPGLGKAVTPLPGCHFTSIPVISTGSTQNSPPPLFFQLRVHVEFLPDLFCVADLGGICVRDLLLREGESG